MSYYSYFLNSSSSVVQLELFEISHPSFSKTYRIVRNAVDGVTVTLEDASSHLFEYYPLKVTPATSGDDLEQVLNIDLGDLGQVVPQEIDAVNAAGTLSTKPTLIYRTYRSDDLSAPLEGPHRFQVNNISFKKEGASFEASAPKVNQTSTGEIYTLDRFPMLQGFL
jgi:hypothetical protein